MKKRKQISMKDISRELGISITTISFIINKKAENKISKEVIKKVEDYIEKVGYIPNSSAQTLRTGKSKTIVFMAEDISDPFFSAIAKEMEEIAFNNGYKIIYCSTENKKERALELLELFKNRHVDAFIITPPENFEAEIQKLIYEEQQLVIVFDRYYKNFKHNFVVLENRKSAEEAATELYKRNCKQIALVGIQSKLSSLIDRTEGYLNVCYQNKLTPITLLLKFNEVKTLEGRKKIKEFLLSHPEIDSILFATNNLAINGLRVMKELELKIPEDIAVISFDERDLFELNTPPISVVAQPVSQLAAELIKGTLKLLKRKPANQEFYQKILDAKLILRESLPAKEPIYLKADT